MRNLSLVVCGDTSRRGFEIGFGSSRGFEIGFGAGRGFEIGYVAAAGQAASGTPRGVDAR